MQAIGERLGNTVKICRNRKNLNQGELAERAGLSVSYLSLIEQGKRTPNLEVIESIADALELPLNMLIFLASDKTKLTELDQGTAERLALLAWKLIENEDEQSVLQP